MVVPWRYSGFAQKKLCAQIDLNDHEPRLRVTTLFHPSAPTFGVNTVVVSTFVSSAFNAVETISRRSCPSNSAGKLGSPQG